MKYYWPMAIIVTEDGPDLLSTYNSALSFDKAEKQFEIWQNHYHDRIAARWIDIIDENNVKARSVKRIDMDLVKELWEQFGDIPMNEETECIEAWWGSALWCKAFRPGTHREDIWKWFEETFDISVAEELMNI